MTRYPPHNPADARHEPASHPMPMPQPPRKPGKRRNKRRRQRPVRKSSWALRVLVTVLALVALPLAGLAAVMLITSPGKHLRDKLIREVHHRTGRTIEVRGGISFVAAPQPGIVLSRITVPAPEGMSGPATLTARSLQLDIALAPLLRGRIVVEQASLIDPTIDLRVDRNGRRSWQITARPPRADHRRAGRATGRTRPAAAGAPLSKAAAGPGVQWLSRFQRAQFALQRLRVLNGSIRYTDVRTGRQDRLDALDLDLVGPRLNAKLAVNGAVRWRNERLTLKGRLETLPLLLANQPAKAKLAIIGADTTAGFNGTLHLAHKLNAHGLIGFTTASLARFLNWQGIALPQTNALGRLHANGYLSIANDTIKLASGFVVLDTARANGSLAVMLGGDRPTVTADLKISQLDTDRLARVLRAAHQTSAAVFRPQGRNAAPRSIDELLRGSETGRGVGRFSLPPHTASGRKGWSTDPIDVAAWRSLDIDARLAVDGLTLGGLKFTQATMQIALRDGNLRADINDALLYGGRVRTRVTARPGPSGLIVGLNCFTEGVAAGDLLGDTAGTQTLTGSTRFAAKLSGLGASEQQIMASLAGTARIALTQGAVAGWDVSAILGELKRGRVPELRRDEAEKTAFRELSATFGVNGGIAKTGDLRMVTDAVAMGGKGDVDIGRRRLDLLTSTRPITKAKASRDRSPIEGLVLPIRVRGTWDKPSVTLEIENAFRNPDKARKVLRKARRRFKGRDPKEVVRGILRDGKKSKDVRAAKKALKDLFR